MDACRKTVIVLSSFGQYKKIQGEGQGPHGSNQNSFFLLLFFLSFLLSSSSLSSLTPSFLPLCLLYFLSLCLPFLILPSFPPFFLSVFLLFILPSILSSIHPICLPYFLSSFFPFFKFLPSFFFSFPLFHLLLCHHHYFSFCPPSQTPTYVFFYLSL